MVCGGGGGDCAWCLCLLCCALLVQRRGLVDINMMLRFGERLRFGTVRVFRDRSAHHTDYVEK